MKHMSMYFFTSVRDLDSIVVILSQIIDNTEVIIINLLIHIDATYHYEHARELTVCIDK
jgi:hypothetical protein